jgi:lysophospholipase L1-like esterase
MENTLNTDQHRIRVIEDCLNGRRTVWEDPFKPGRNGLTGLQQRIEICSPLSLVILLLGTNDFQSMHQNNVYHSAQGIASLVNAIRTAPIEPGMPVPPILVVAPPPVSAAKGAIAAKFEGAELKCHDLASAYRKVCEELDCHFFDAGTVVQSSQVDGIHLDAAEHLILGRALAALVAKLI